MKHAFLALGPVLVGLLCAGSAIAQDQPKTSQEPGEIENPDSTQNKNRPVDKTTPPERSNRENEATHPGNSVPESHGTPAERTNRQVNAAQAGSTDSVLAKDRPSPSDVLERLHAANIDEIEDGKLAQQNGTPAVGDYAKMLVSDHESADKTVAQLAGKMRVKLSNKPHDSMARSMQSDGMKMHDELSRLKGAEFDRAFARDMVEDDRKAIEMVDAARTTCTEPQICSLLDQVKPVLEKHLQAAKQLQRPMAQGRKP